MSLVANNFLYEAGVDWVKASEPRPEECLRAIWRVGQLAWEHHPGRFADGALENPAFRIGVRVVKSPPANLPKFRLVKGNSSRTLHVVTTVYSVGGHSRVLAKWVLGDRKSTSGIVILDQKEPCPAFLEDATTKIGGEVVSLPTSASMMDKAGMLRGLSKQFDRVILHTHPQDPVPVVAFATVDVPPVAMFNHAHFSFCVGSTVSDGIINTMEYFREVTKKFRFARHTAILTGTPGLVPLKSDPIDKAHGKQLLGIEVATPLVMSIGAERYFRPMEGYDFFRMAARLLKQNPTVVFVMVGVSSQSPLIPDELKSNSRFRCVGPVTDPSAYYRAADLCLESFPMPSLGALVEAVAYGEAFPVPVYGPDESILRVSPAPVLSHGYRPKDEDDYLMFVGRLLEDRGETQQLARELRLSMIQYDEGWNERVDDINRFIDAMKHTPGEIPKAPMNDSSDCQILAAMNSANLMTGFNGFPYRRAVISQLKAVSKRLLGPVDAATRIVQRPIAALKRRAGEAANLAKICL